MFRGILLSMILIALIAAQSPCEERITIGILDLEAGGVSTAEAVSITNRIRNELFLTGRYKVVERGAMQEILTEVGFQMAGCTTSECIVQAGRILGVQQMVAGSLDKLGQLYTINLRMINVETGEILAVASADCQGAIEEVALKSTKEAVKRLIGEQISGIDETLPFEQKEERNYQGGMKNGFIPDRAMTLRRRTFIIRFSNSYENINMDYNWYWEEFEEGWLDKERIEGRVVLGYGISDNLEISTQFPPAIQKQDTNGTYSGAGDFIVQTRYAVKPWSVDKSGISLAGGIRIGNSGKVSDGTTDFLLSGIYSTSWLKSVRLNLELKGWMNGEKDNGINIGNSINILLPIELMISNKFILCSTITYYSKGQDKFFGNISNSGIKRSHLFFNVIYSSNQVFFINPSIRLPFVFNKGGSMSTVKFMIDLWYLL